MRGRNFMIGFYPLHNEGVVITGIFEDYSRCELEDRLISLGAIIQADVSMQTSILFVGLHDSSFVGKRSISIALSLIDKGIPISIVREDELDIFFNIMKKRIGFTDGTDQYTFYV
jgi:BRCT domain type II-containing protein